jgi:hypothetical protein
MTPQHGLECHKGRLVPFVCHCRCIPAVEYFPFRKNLEDFSLSFTHNIERVACADLAPS